MYIGLVQLKLILFGTLWLDVRQKRQTQVEDYNLSVAESWESRGLKLNDKCIAEAYSPGPEVCRQRGHTSLWDRVKVDAELPENIYQRNMVIHLCPEIPSIKLHDIRRIKLCNVYDSI